MSGSETGQHLGKSCLLITAKVRTNVVFDVEGCGVEVGSVDKGVGEEAQDCESVVEAVGGVGERGSTRWGGSGEDREDIVMPSDQPREINAMHKGNIEIKPFP